MTIEEKLKESSFKHRKKLSGEWGTADVMFLTDAIRICQQQIKQACDKQKEICHDIYVDHTDREIEADDLILNAPYPEGVEK